MHNPELVVVYHTGRFRSFILEPGDSWKWTSDCLVVKRGDGSNHRTEIPRENIAELQVNALNTQQRLENEYEESNEQRAPIHVHVEPCNICRPGEHFTGLRDPAMGGPGHVLRDAAECGGGADCPPADGTE